MRVRMSARALLDSQAFFLHAWPLQKSPSACVHCILTPLCVCALVCMRAGGHDGRVQQHPLLRGAAVPGPGPAAIRQAAGCRAHDRKSGQGALPLLHQYPPAVAPIRHPGGQRPPRGMRPSLCAFCTTPLACACAWRMAGGGKRLLLAPCLALDCVCSCVFVYVCLCVPLPI